MNSDPQFRVAVESDADLLLDFMRSYYAFDGHGFDGEKARDALIPLLGNPDYGRAWLILDNGSPVGYIVVCFGYSLEWLGRDAFVDEFYLRAKYRGRGWGQKVMAFLEDAGP
jgi:GNAT superfamily N-acetyltransferase